MPVRVPPLICLFTKQPKLLGYWRTIFHKIESGPPFLNEIISKGLGEVNENHPSRKFTLYFVVKSR